MTFLYDNPLPLWIFIVLWVGVGENILPEAKINIFDSNNCLWIHNKTFFFNKMTRPIFPYKFFQVTIKYYCPERSINFFFVQEIVVYLCIVSCLHLYACYRIEIRVVTVIFVFVFFFVSDIFLLKNKHLMKWKFSFYIYFEKEKKNRTNTESDMELGVQITWRK